MIKKKNFIIKPIALFGYAFIYLPLLFVALQSFNSSQTMSWGGFSIKWYKQLFSNSEIIAASIISIKIAFASSSISVLIGTICAYAWSHLTPKREFLGKVAISHTCYT